MKAAPFPSLIFACLSLLALAGCATNPVSGRQEFVATSEADELRLGQKSDQEVRQEYGVYDMPALQKYVDRVGQRLARVSHRPGLTYHFVVVDSPDINAFALPGGYIYVTRGILAYLNSEAELAAVLGHEIGHVTARHAVRQYTAATAASAGVVLGSLLVPQLANQGAQSAMNLLGNAMLSGYGRDHELEADRLGAEYLARAGYDPQAMVRVIRVLKNQELFAAKQAKQDGRQPRTYHGLFDTHPDNDTRLQEVVAEAGHLTLPSVREGRADYLAQLDGVTFGDSPDQGLVRDNVFYHEKLGFVLTFPGQWKISNGARGITGRSPSGDGWLELGLAKRPTLPPGEFLRRGLTPDSGGSQDAGSVNGLPAAIFTGTKQGRPIKVAVIYQGDLAYVMIGGASSTESFSHWSPRMDESMRSFRAYTAADRGRARAYVIRTTVATPGTTYHRLAERSPLGKDGEDLLRLMNADYPDGEPQPGRSLKIVE